MSGFISPTKQLSGIRQSAIFVHLSRTDDRSFKASLQNKTVIAFKKPTFRRNSFILELNSARVSDIFSDLPDEIKSKYKFVTKEYHISCDGTFWAGDKGDGRDALRQWHATARATVSNGKELVIHIYFVGTKCTGVYIKLPEKEHQEKIDDSVFIRHAERHAATHLSVIELILRDIQKEINLQRDKLQQLLGKMNGIEYFNANTDEQVSLDLAAASAQNDTVSSYLENETSSEFEFVEKCVKQWRAMRAQKKLVAKSSSSNSEEDVDVKSLQKQVEAMSASSGSSSPRVFIGKTRRNSSVSTKSATPTYELGDVTYESVKNETFELLAMANTKGFPKTADEAFTFNARVEELKLQLIVAFINANDSAEEKKIKTLQGIVKKELPTLTDSFFRFAAAVNIKEAKELFPKIHYIIPGKIYINFFSEIWEGDYQGDEYNRVVRLCKFMCETSDVARIYFSFSGQFLTKISDSSNKTTIYRSQLFNEVAKRRPDLLALFFSTSSSSDYKGYVHNKYKASLLEVACASSDINGKVVTEILKYSPQTENPFPFAKGYIAENLIKEEVAFNTNTTPEDELLSAADILKLQDEVVEHTTKYFWHIPFVGSALAAYCANSYIISELSRSILGRLTNVTSTLHLVLSFGYFLSKGHVGASLLYFEQPVYLQAEASFVFREARSNGSFNSHGNKKAKYIGCLLGIGVNSNEGKGAHADLEYFMNILDARLKASSQEQLRTIVEQLKQSYDVYITNGNFFGAVACGRAIYVTCMYMEPTLEVHTTILNAMMNVGDSYANDITAKTIPMLIENVDGFDEQARYYEKIRHYWFAEVVSLASVHSDALRTHPKLPKIQQELEESNSEYSKGSGPKKQL